MVDPVRSALGLVKELLPFSIGGGVPLPRIPDVPAFLNSLLALLEGNSDAKTEPVEPLALVSPLDEDEERARDELRKQLEARLRHLPQDGASAEVQQILQVLRRLDGGEGVIVPESQEPVLPEPVPPAPAAMEPPTETIPRTEEAAVVEPPSALSGIESRPAAVPSSPVSAVPEAGPPGPPVTVVLPTAGLPPPPPVEKAANPPVPAEAGGRRTLEARAAAPGGPELPFTPVQERAEFIDRMVKAARLTQARGESRIRLLLHPPHLGELRVDLAIHENVLRGELRAETEEARDLILAHLESLKHALEGQGIQVGDFQVTVDQAFARPDESPGPAAALPAEAHEPAAPAASPRRALDAQWIDLLA